MIEIEKKDDGATLEAKEATEEIGVDTVWERYLAQLPQCGFGQLGLCCKNCNFGPCRIDPFGEGPKVGICGADADVISARNLLRHTASGAACHSDHGREIAHTLLLVAEGKAKNYEIKDEVKLKTVAKEFGIEVDNKPVLQIAKELALVILAEFGQQIGELTFAKMRPPERQKNIWREYKIMPRGIDREIVEAMARTHMGVDNEYKNLLFHTMRTALADGWGGSMVATELCDILFSTPKAVRGKVNLGVLREKAVNIVVHGHVPLLSEMIVEAAKDKELLELAAKLGAEGVNVVGICCTANEVLMRKGVPVAGSVLQQELAIATGVVDAMVVDIQCVMPALKEISKCYHTKLISTHPKGKFSGMEYVEFREEDAYDIAKEIVKKGVENFANRKEELIKIPKETKELIAGFSTEYIFHMLGGKYRFTYKPLNDAIRDGRIRGVAGLVGCNNPKLMSGQSHVILAKELIKKDVLVVETGCAAIECAKAGLLTPEAAFEYAGKGLREVCEAVGIPPVLHLGSCVDNSRILTACCEIVKEGGVGNSLDELPVAGAALEWYSEKAIAIGWYFVASGALVVFGTPFPVTGSRNVLKFCTEEVEKITGGKWAFEPDPVKAANLMIEHINKKREQLKLKPVMYE